MTQQILFVEKTFITCVGVTVPAPNFLTTDAFGIGSFH